MGDDWLTTSDVLNKFQAVFEASEGKGDKADAIAFAEASLALISVFDLISGMGVASGDMKGNANTVKSLGGEGKTLGALVSGECDGKSDGEIKKIVGNGKTATCAL